MIGRIESELDTARQLAVFGIDTPGTQRYIKAFRLKNFGRCPRCDRGLKRADDTRTQSYLMWCVSCKWNYTIDKLVVIRASDIDDIYLSIIDAANSMIPAFHSLPVPEHLREHIQIKRREVENDSGR